MDADIMKFIGFLLVSNKSFICQKMHKLNLTKPITKYKLVIKSP